MSGHSRTAVSAESPRPVAGHSLNDSVRTDPADPLVQSIGDEEIAVVIDRDTPRIIQHGQRCGTTIASEAPAAGTSDSGHHSGGTDLANAIVSCIRNINIAACIDCHSPGIVELSRCRGPAVSAETPTAIAGNGRDRTPRSDLADPLIICFGDEQIARAIHNTHVRVIELSCQSGTAIVSDSGDRSDYTGRVDLTDSVVAPVRDEEIAAAIDGNIDRKPELGGSHSATIAAKARCIAHDSRDDACGVDHADSVVAAVGDKDIAAVVHSDTTRIPNLSGARRASLSTESAATAAG